MTVFTQSLWAFVSATVIITSTTREQMLIGRILNYVYVVSTLVPLISNDQSQCGVGLKLASGHGILRHSSLPDGDHACSCAGFRRGVVSVVDCELQHVDQAGSAADT
jgi:hypothetical protein